MAEFKLMSYGANSRQARAGILSGNKVYDAERLTGRSDYRSALGIIEDWASAEDLIGQALDKAGHTAVGDINACLLYTSPSPRDRTRSRMPSSA